MLAVLVPGWSFGELAIALIIIVAIVAVVVVVIKVAQIPIPWWIVHIAWILAVAFVAIFAIRLLMSM